VADKITAVVAPTVQSDKTQQMLQSYANFITMFLQATLQLAGKVAQPGHAIISAVQPLTQSPWRNLHFQFAAVGTQAFLCDRKYFVVFALTTGMNVCISSDGTTAANAAAAITKMNTGIISHIAGNNANWVGRVPLEQGTSMYVAAAAAGTVNIGLELA
jgi:hypothetical protein